MSTGRLGQVLARSLLACGLALLFTGCGKGDAQLRFVNTSPGESSLDCSLDGTTIASRIAYEAGSNYASTIPGPRHLQVYSSGTTNAIIDQTVNLSSGTDYSLFAINFSSDVSAVLLTDNNSTPSSGSIKLRVLNVSPGLAAVDVYVVTPGTDLNTATASVISLAFQSSSNYVVEIAGSWEYGLHLAWPEDCTAQHRHADARFRSDSHSYRSQLEAGGYTTAVLNDLN